MDLRLLGTCLVLAAAATPACGTFTKVSENKNEEVQPEQKSLAVEGAKTQQVSEENGKFAVYVESAGAAHITVSNTADGTVELKGGGVIELKGDGTVKIALDPSVANSKVEIIDSGKGQAEVEVRGANPVKVIIKHTNGRTYRVLAAGKNAEIEESIDNQPVSGGGTPGGGTGGGTGGGNPPVPPPSNGQSGTLVINVTDIPAATGRICFTLLSQGNKKYFAREDATADKMTREGCRDVRASTMEIRLDGVPFDTYAIGLYHDANGNNKVDKRGPLPIEGVGFSRNPKLGFSAPSFESCSFVVGAGTTTQMVKVVKVLPGL